MELFPLPGTLATLPRALSSEHRRSHISGGDAGTAQTIQHMRRLVSQGKREWSKRKLVGKIIRGEAIEGFPGFRGKPCANKDFLCYAENIFLFCRDGMKYAFDPHGVELVEHPVKILETGIGDCDSLDVLFASMCEAIGLQCVFVTIKSNPSRPSEYSHVYCRVNVPKHGWLGADPTQPTKPLGWEPPGQYETKVWPASLETEKCPEGATMIGEGPVPGVRWSGEERAGAGSDLSIMLSDFSDHNRPRNVKAVCAQLRKRIQREPNPRQRARIMEVIKRLECPGPFPRGMSGLDDCSCQSNKTVGIKTPVENMFAGVTMFTTADDMFGGIKTGLGALDFGRRQDRACDRAQAAVKKHCATIKPVFPIATTNPVNMSGLGDYSAFSRMIGLDKAAIVMKVADGSLHKELVEAQKRQQDMNGRINGDLAIAVRNMPEGPNKQAALASWQKAKATNDQNYNNLRQAIDNYNTVASTIRTVTLGYTQPPMMAIAPLAIAAIIAAAGFALTALSNIVGKIVGAEADTKGFIQQTAELVQAGGGFVRESNEMLKTLGYAALIGGAGFLAWKVFDRLIDRYPAPRRRALAGA